MHIYDPYLIYFVMGIACNMGRGKEVIRQILYSITDYSYTNM